MGDNNLFQRIVAVMGDMGAVGKGGKTSYGEKYAYHRIDDIDDKLRHALVQHGVVATIVSIDDRKLEHLQETDKQGKPRTTWYAECLLTIELVNADDPEQRATIKGWGQGLDYSDKATGKAISYAAKAAYLSAFHLRGQPDSEQDDIRRRAPVAPTLSEEDAAFIEQATLDIEHADQAMLDDYGKRLAGKNAAIQNALRPVWAARNKYLQGK